jgi:hypothetical protein
MEDYMTIGVWALLFIVTIIVLIAATEWNKK